MYTPRLSRPNGQPRCAVHPGPRSSHRVEGPAPAYHGPRPSITTMAAELRDEEEMPLLGLPSPRLYTILSSSPSLLTAPCLSFTSLSPLSLFQTPHSLSPLLACRAGPVIHPHLLVSHVLFFFFFLGDDILLESGLLRVIHSPFCAARNQLLSASSTTLSVHIFERHTKPQVPETPFSALKIPFFCVC